MCRFDLLALLEGKNVCVANTFLMEPNIVDFFMNLVSVLELR